MGEVGSNGVVVSLTTFGKRLDTVYLAVLSMMHQTAKPDLIVLWLDRGMTLSDIPSSLHRLVPYGLIYVTTVRILRGIRNTIGR